MKLDIQLFAASKSTSFSESNISTANNTSSLTINIYFSANNQTTWFQSATLYCTCNGVTQSQTVSHSRGGSVSASFTFNNIAHNSDGSKSVSWSWSCATGTSVLGTIGDSGNQPLTKIARQANIKSAPNFNDEENPTITFENKGGFPINARMEFAGTSINKQNIANTGTYTFNLTNEERTLLRQKCTSTSMTVRFVIGTRINSSSETHWTWLDRTMTIINGNPVFSNFEAMDVNLTTVALTDDSTVNVNGYSNIRATISTVNKAVAQKEATMVKYRFVIGDKTIDINYDDEESVSGIIYNAPNGIYNVYAIDSRGNSTLVTRLASSEIAYEPITLDKSNCSVERNDNNYGDTAILKFAGKFWKQRFGVGYNLFMNAEYQFKKTSDSEWINGTTYLYPTTINDDGTFEFEGAIASDNQDTKWDLQSAYDVKISVSDSLSTTIFQLTPMTSARPHLCYADDGIGIMCDYDETLGGALQVAGGKVLSAHTLFDDYSNTTDSITLSDSLENYDFMEIYFKEKTVGINGYTKVYNPNGKDVTLFVQKMNSGSGYMTHYLSRYQLRTTTISLLMNGHYNIVNNTVADCGTSGSGAEIYITKVIGYK